MQKRLFVISLIFMLFLAGCTSNGEVTKVDDVDSTKTSNEDVSANENADTNEGDSGDQVTTEETENVKTYEVANVGETLTDDKLKITLNSVEYMETIPNENEFLIETTETGKTFVITDVTIENVDNEATSISSLMQFEVKDSVEGYKYESDMMATISLDQQVDGTLQPGDKIRGKLAFQVPLDAKELQLVFTFDFIGKTQAKFNLGKPE